MMRYASVNQPTLQAFFELAKERREWGIKFITDLDRAVATAAVKELAEDGARPSGANYLKLKQMQRTMRNPVLDQLHRDCDLRIEQLREKVAHCLVRPNRSLAQPDRETLLANVALWLNPDEHSRVLELCEQWNNCAPHRLPLWPPQLAHGHPIPSAHRWAMLNRSSKRPSP